MLARLPQKFTPAVANSDFCGMLHPTQPDHCNKHFAGILPLLFSRSLAVYLPVYTASTLAVQRGRLLKRPQLVLSRMLLGIGRSSTFLAIYVAVAHRGVCRRLVIRRLGTPSAALACQACAMQSLTAC